MDVIDVFCKVIKGETKKINREDECVLWAFLATVYGDENVLTEILWNEDRRDLEYFGCAVRVDGIWRVYNLIGSGGVVVYFGHYPRLAMKAG